MSYGIWCSQTEGLTEFDRTKAGIMDLIKLNKCQNCCSGEPSFTQHDAVQTDEF